MDWGLEIRIGDWGCGLGWGLGLGIGDWDLGLGIGDRGSRIGDCEL